MGLIYDNPSSSSVRPGPLLIKISRLRLYFYHCEARMKSKLEMVIRKELFLNKLMRSKLVSGGFRIEWWNLRNLLKISDAGDG